MKRAIFVIGGIICLIFTIIFAMPRSVNTEDYLRIHIRANSNSEIDQDIKYKIKGRIVEFLSPKLKEAKSVDEAKNIVIHNITNINSIANDVLNEENLSYKAVSELNREYFPVRHYGNVTLEEGVYDALIVRLGEASGNNWWCVVFPPLCFVESEESGDGNFHYVSKIREIIENIRRK